MHSLHALRSLVVSAWKMNRLTVQSSAGASLARSPLTSLGVVVIWRRALGYSFYAT